MNTRITAVIALVLCSVGCAATPAPVALVPAAEAVEDLAPSVLAQHNANTAFSTSEVANPDERPLLEICWSQHD